MVGRAFPYLGLLVFEPFEGIRNIIWHGKVNAAGVIIPIKGEAEVALAFPILCNVIVLFDAFNEVVIMVLTNIIYSKSVHDERETDRPPFMCPQTGCNLDLVLAMGIEVCFKECLGKDSTLGKPIHSLLDVYINKSIWGRFFT